MSRLAAIALATCTATSAFAAPNAGVSIGIVQPGVYGRVDVGHYPSPALVSQEPVVIRQTRYAMHQRPIYFYVPAQHQQHWARYCGRYNACGQPVYFVQERWVRERYQHEHPRWGEKHADRRHWENR